MIYGAKHLSRALVQQLLRVFIYKWRSVFVNVRFKCTKYHFSTLCANKTVFHGLTTFFDNIDNFATLFTTRSSFARQKMPE